MPRPLITVRQTTDPYVEDIQYIGSHEVPLKRNGSLPMSKIGLGKPGDKFLLVSRQEQRRTILPLVTTFHPSDILYPTHIRMMDSYEAPYPILTIVETGDHGSAYERHSRRIGAIDRERQLAYLKGLVTHPWNWVAPVFPSVHLQSKESQRLDLLPMRPGDPQSGNAGSVSTCVPDSRNASRLVHRRRIGTPKSRDSGSEVAVDEVNGEVFSRRDKRFFKYL